LPTIEESATKLAEYLRGESAADLLGTSQEPRDVLAIRESLLDVAELVDSNVNDGPAPGWMTNDAHELTTEELYDALTRARWAAWTATAALIATTGAAANIAATYAPVDSD
jgi:hypothetical protein